MQLRVLEDELVEEVRRANDNASNHTPGPPDPRRDQDWHDRQATTIRVVIPQITRVPCDLINGASRDLVRLLELEHEHNPVLEQQHVGPATALSRKFVL